MVYAQPGTEAGIVSFAPRYDNFIGGDWVAPVESRCIENFSPVTGKVFFAVARSTAADRWGRTSIAERARLLNRIADRIEENLERGTWRAASEVVASRCAVPPPHRAPGGPARNQHRLHEPPTVRESAS